ALVSPPTRLDACEEKATNRPSSLMAGSSLVLLPISLLETCVTMNGAFRATRAYTSGAAFVSAGAPGGWRFVASVWNTMLKLVLSEDDGAIRGLVLAPFPHAAVLGLALTANRPEKPLRLRYTCVTLFVLCP